jgi:hypothetical protein
VQTSSASSSTISDTMARLKDFMRVKKISEPLKPGLHIMVFVMVGIWVVT